MQKITIAALLLVGGALEVQAQPMSADELRAFVAGKTVHLDSPIGTLPVTYNPDGTLSGRTANVALAAYLGSSSDRGRWQIKGDKICQKFFRWLHGEMSCVTFRQDGRKISWRREDGLTGTATIAANDADPPPTPAGLGVPPTASAQAPANEQADSKTPPAVADAAASQPQAPGHVSPAPAVAAVPAKPHPTGAPRPPAFAIASVASLPAARPRPKPPVFKVITPIEPEASGAHAAAAASPGPVPAGSPPVALVAGASAAADAAAPRASAIITREVAAQHEAYHWCSQPVAAVAAPASPLASMLGATAAPPSTACFMAIPGLADMARRMLGMY